MNSNTQSVAPNPMILVIIWSAFVMATFVYAFIPLIVGRESASTPSETVAIAPDGEQSDKESEGVQPVILMVISILALSEICIGILWPRFMPVTEDLKADQFLARYQTQMIIRAALFEAIAIYGVVLFFLRAEMYVTWIFCGVSTLALISMGPGIFSTIDKYKMKERSGR